MIFTQLKWWMNHDESSQPQIFQWAVVKQSPIARDTFPMMWTLTHAVTLLLLQAIRETKDTWDQKVMWIHQISFRLLKYFSIRKKGSVLSKSSGDFHSTLNQLTNCEWWIPEICGPNNLVEMWDARWKCTSIFSNTICTQTLSCGFSSAGDKGDVGLAGPVGPMGPKGEKNEGMSSRLHKHKTNYFREINLLLNLFQMALPAKLGRQCVEHNFYAQYTTMNAFSREHCDGQSVGINSSIAYNLLRCTLSLNSCCRRQGR